MGKQLMLRHKWFMLLVALQIVNFATMLLLEQQRRSIWNKEAANAQRILDTKFFTEKTEENYRYLARLVDDLKVRTNEIQSEARQNIGNAALIRDTRDRVMNIESSLQKLQPGK
jgi:hypothetical protein